MATTDTLLTPHTDAMALAPAVGSALDTTLMVGRTKNSQVMHATSRARHTIYGYHKSLCGADLQEMLWAQIAPEEIDCINCRKIAMRDTRNTERSNRADEESNLKPE